jgi:hypothetical protein
LRTNELARRRIIDSGSVREDPYPAWVDAHYLISAWDPTQDTSSAAINEQKVLASVSSVLLSGDPFTPEKVYAPAEASEVGNLIAAFGVANAAALQRVLDTALGQWPTEFRVPGLPYEVLPPTGFPNLSDFWTTMGQGSAWKAVVYLVANVPILLDKGQEFPEVTTISTVTGQTADGQARRLVTGTEHVWHQIGGRVLRFEAPPAAMTPLPLARVILQAPGRNTDGTAGPMAPIQDDRSDGEGRFRFVFAGEDLSNRIAPFTTKYQLVARVPGLIGKPLDVDLNPTSRFAHDIVLRKE